MSQALSKADAPPVIEVVYNVLAAGWRRRYVIALPILLLPIIGAVLGHFAPRSYQTSMSILIQEPDDLNPFLADLAVKTNLKGRIQALRALLTSRENLLQVATDVGMLSEHASKQQQDRVVAQLAGAVKVTLIGNEMVSLTYESRDPRGMARILTRLGDRFIARVEAPENSSMRGSVVFLREQLKSANHRMEVAEQNLAQFETDNAEQLPDLRATNVQRLAKLSDQLAEREVALAGAEAQLANMKERLAQTDPVVGRIEQDIVTVSSQLALLRVRYTEHHSKVEAAEHELARLEAERNRLMQADLRPPPTNSADTDRLWNMASVAKLGPNGTQPLLISQATQLESARIKVEELRSEVADLRKSVLALRKRVDSAGEVGRRLSDLQRDVKVTSDLVAQLRRRFEMARVTGDLSRFQEPQHVAVIDHPVQPTAPTRPITLLFTLGGIVAGIALGIGLAVLLELMDTTVRTARAMQRITGVPVLARINPLEQRWV